MGAINPSRVEETFDEDTEMGGIRTIYRAVREEVEPLPESENKEEKPAAPQAPAEASSGPSPELLEELRLRRRQRKRHPPKKSFAGQVLGKAFLFAAITGVALGLAYVFNTYF